MQDRHQYLLEWQRKMDPTNFNKSRGAQYHTAPQVVMPGTDGYPDDLPEDSVTFLFRIKEDSWLGEPERTVIDNPLLIEKEPREGAKNGPVFVLGDAAAVAAIACNENYYWTANVLAKHQALRITFLPDKKRTDGKKRGITVYATFMPNDDEKEL